MRKKATAFCALAAVCLSLAGCSIPLPRVGPLGDPGFEAEMETSQEEETEVPDDDWLFQQEETPQTEAPQTEPSANAGDET